MANDQERQQERYQLVQQLIPLLDRPTRPNGAGAVMAFCPTHPDGQKSGRRSLSVGPKYGIKCFAGCTWKEVEEYYFGKDGSPRKEAPDYTASLGAPSAEYPYYDTSGDLVVTKGRFEIGREKTFRHKPRGALLYGGLEGLKEEDIPLYRAADIARADAESTVYFVEGEKAAGALKDKGLLSTTLYQSAGSKFINPKTLDILRRHKIVLWPDNDPPGREHMMRVESALRDVNILSSWIVLSRSLPFKGDAYDFFYVIEGASVEELQGASLSEPKLEYLEDSGLRVTYPVSGRAFTFTFTEIERTKRTMDAQLVISPVGSLGSVEDYTERINLLSNTQITELRRNLDNVYGDKKDGFQWTKVVSSVVSIARSGYDTIDRSIDVVSINMPDEDLFLIQDLLPFGSPTIWFGDGSSAKSMLVELLLVHSALGIEFARFRGPVFKTLFIDYEDTPANFRRRCERMAQGLGLELPSKMITYWDSMGVPLPQLVDALRVKIREEGIDLVIVDSIAPACGGDPLNADVVDAYFRAVRKLGVTTLHIAHITKEDDKRLTANHPATKKPFGSIMWHNRARRTFFILREQEEEVDTIQVGFVNRKVNDGVLLGPRLVELTFAPDQGPITVDRIRRASEGSLLSKVGSAASRIWDALIQPLTVDDIAEQLEMEPGTVQRTLTRYKERFVQAGTRPSESGRPENIWSRVATEEFAGLSPEAEPQRQIRLPDGLPNLADESSQFPNRGESDDQLPF